MRRGGAADLHHGGVLRSLRLEACRRRNAHGLLGLQQHGGGTAFVGPGLQREVEEVCSVPG